MLALILLTSAAPVHAGEAERVLLPVPAEAPAWSFDLAPYYWSATISGSITIDGDEVNVEGGGDGFFHDPALLGYLGHFEARHGPWTFGFAPMFINIDMTGAEPPNTDAALNFKAQVHEAFVAREFAEGWEWLVGARYQKLETDIDLSIGGVPQSTLSSSHSWVDPIIGLRYETGLGGDWTLRARGDIGGFGLGSQFVWNASAVARYKFSGLFGTYLGYRALSFDFESGSGSGRLAYDLSMYGPIIGISFSF